MKNLKRLISVVLAIAALLAMNTIAFAAVDDTGYSDVAATAWYADAVAYVTENGLMNGTGTAAFSPNANMELAMLVTILMPVRLPQKPTHPPVFLPGAGTKLRPLGRMKPVCSGISTLPLPARPLLVRTWSPSSGGMLEVL